MGRAGATSMRLVRYTSEDTGAGGPFMKSLGVIGVAVELRTRWGLLLLATAGSRPVPAVTGGNEGRGFGLHRWRRCLAGGQSCSIDCAASSSSACMSIGWRICQGGQPPAGVGAYGMLTRRGEIWSRRRAVEFFPTRFRCEFCVSNVGWKFCCLGETRRYGHGAAH